MPAFVALLRGVNVGKANRVAMADWRAQLERLGYAQVATLLNSGNAAFTAARAPSARHADAIASALETSLKTTVPVVVKSGTELAAIVDENPFAKRGADPSRLLVAYAQDPRALAGLAPLARLAVAPEAFVVGAHAAWLHCPAGILGSAVGKALLGKAGRSVTTRNWATTLKLKQLADERDG